MLSSAVTVRTHLSREVISHLRQAVQEAQSARDKKIVALVGPTGVGKSTTANHLLGKTLHVVRTDAGRRLEVEGDPAAAISHSATVSQTLFAQVFPLPDRPDTVLVDCGGFYDSRGLSTEITTVTSMKLTMEAGANVKLALCCMHASLTTDRAAHLIELIRTLSTQVLNNQSILLLITRPLIEDPAYPPTTESIIEELRYLLQGTQDEELRQIFTFILRDNGKYVLLYDPLNPQCRDRFNQIIEELTPLQPHSFNPIYSANAILSILDEMTSIAARGNALFDRWERNRREFQTFRDHQDRLLARRQQLQASIDQFNPTERTNQRAIHEGNIRVAQDQLDELRRRIREEEDKCEEANKRFVYFDQFCTGRSRLTKIEEEINAIIEVEHQLSLQSREKANEISRAKIAIEEIDHQLAQMTRLKDELQIVEGEQKAIESNQQELYRELQELKQNFGQENPNFRFLIDFKNLSQNPELNRAEIEQFIEKYNEYISGRV